MTLNDKITKLEQKIRGLEAKVIDLTDKTESGRHKPESVVPQIDLGKQVPLPSSGTGLGKVPGRQGNLILNDAEAQNVPWGTQPATPTKGYNKHGHSEFSGGALDINTLEVIEYETDESTNILDQYGNILNKHSQSYWKFPAKIAKDDNQVEKKGSIRSNFVWDKDNAVWRFLAVYAD